MLSAITVTFASNSSFNSLVPVDIADPFTFAPWANTTASNFLFASTVGVSGNWISQSLTTLRTAQVTSHFSLRYFSRIAPPRVPVDPKIRRFGIVYFSKP